MLHNAAAILQKYMSEVLQARDVYPSFMDINVTKCAKFGPDAMYDFVH